MKLKILEVKAKTVGEACADVENGAGQKELHYVLTHYNEFPEMHDGNWYYFPNVGGGEEVPCVSWGAGEFWRRSFRRGLGWHSRDRVVVRDLALPIDSDLEHVHYYRFSHQEKEPVYGGTNTMKYDVVVCSECGDVKRQVSAYQP